MAEKLKNILEDKEIETTREKKRFFSGLRNRLLSLATAGFITLGADWGQGLARQLNIEDKKEAITEFIVENEITHDALNDFRSKVERAEPEFRDLIEEYKQSVERGLGGLEEEIIGHNLNDPDHKKYDQQLFEEQQNQWSMGNYEGPDISWTIEKDHNLITLLQSEPESLKNGHKFIRENLDDIFWGMVFLNNSKDSREAMINFVSPPNLLFGAHSSQNRATTIPELSSGKWRPKITVYPVSLMNSERKFDINTYVNVLIHELGHAILAGSGDGKKLVIKMGGIDFATVLDEGRTQALTYKVVNHLRRDNPNFKPVIGEFGEYDQNLVIAEIIEGISRTYPNGDFLVEWQMGIIDHQTMLNNLQKALNELGLNEDIPKLLVDFNFGIDRVKSATQLLSDLIAKLKLGNINLSDEFVRSIIDRNNVRH